MNLLTVAIASFRNLLGLQTVYTPKERTVTHAGIYHHPFMLKAIDSDYVLVAFFFVDVPSQGPPAVFPGSFPVCCYHRGKEIFVNLACKAGGPQSALAPLQVLFVVRRESPFTFLTRETLDRLSLPIMTDSVDNIYPISIHTEKQINCRLSQTENRMNSRLAESEYNVLGDDFFTFNDVILKQEPSTGPVITSNS